MRGCEIATSEYAEKGLTFPDEQVFGMRALLFALRSDFKDRSPMTLPPLPGQEYQFAPGYSNPIQALPFLARFQKQSWESRVKGSHGLASF